MKCLHSGQIGSSQSSIVLCVCVGVWMSAWDNFLFTQGLGFLGVCLNVVLMRSICRPQKNPFSLSTRLSYIDTYMENTSNFNLWNRWRLIALTHQGGQHLPRKNTHYPIATQHYKHTPHHQPELLMCPRYTAEPVGYILDAACVCKCDDAQHHHSSHLSCQHHSSLLPSALETHLSLISPVVAVGCHPVNGSCDVSPQPRRHVEQCCYYYYRRCKWTTCYIGHVY